MKPTGRAFFNLSWTILLLLVVASWALVASEEAARHAPLLSAQTKEQVVRFLRQLAGVESEQPAFLNWASWAKALQLTYETFVMSVLAIGLVGIGVFLTVLPATRTARDGSLTLFRSGWNRLAYYLIRLAYVFSRSVPELVWAMLIVFVFTPGILPGALALAVHNFGILGKLCAEVIEDLDLRPARALRSCGAGTFQVLVYAVLPSVLPQFLTYLLYRWEVIIRTTIVVGFVSAGGLGRQFRLSMSWFHFTDVALLLLCYVLLVYFVELTAAGLRRLAR